MEPLSRYTSLSRRGLLGLAGMASVSWLTPVGHYLARAAEKQPHKAQSVIVLWMQGGPSQLETFDPHPGTLQLLGDEVGRPSFAVRPGVARETEPVGQGHRPLGIEPHEKPRPRPEGPLRRAIGPRPTG